MALAADAPKRGERGPHQEMALGRSQRAIRENLPPHTVGDPSDLAAARQSGLAQAGGYRRIVSAHGFSPLGLIGSPLSSHAFAAAGAPIAVSSSFNWTGKGKTIVLLRSLAITLSVER